jgi:hypothetical protein
VNKITEKWKPILDVFSYTGNKLDKIAFYMENHTYIENLMFDKKHCLPIAMKILIGIENLNLENLTFNVTEKGVTQHKLDVYDDEQEEMSDIEKRIFFETKLIEKAIESINNKIESLNSKGAEIIFETNLLVDDIYFNMDCYRPSMRMKLNYSLKAKQP